MKPAAVFFLLSTAVIGTALLARKLAGAGQGGRVANPYTFASAEGGDWPQDYTMNNVNEAQQQTNVAAFLMMIRKCEGTAGEGGYGALFGWPAIPGREFDPYVATGHPKQFFNYTDKAGKTIRTSAAGAYQITWTTWAGYYLPFVAWAGVQGLSSAGFVPETQDAFAMFLLDLDGALEHVKAGRLGEALAIARRRWASLPGAGYDQPERSQQFVLNAYTEAGGRIA